MKAHSAIGVFFSGIASSWKGMRLTFRHLRNSFSRRNIQRIGHEDYFMKKTGLTTVTYPYESVPVPDHGRYQLHNEIEDCIVCDKCAKICPVDCIEIEPIKSVGEFGKTSDGTSKRIYAAKFDIDMAKCCFCGLCTTVCPTESLTMTPEYDFSTFDLTTLNFGFGNISESEAEEKRREWDDFQAKKQAEKPVTSEQTTESKPASSGFRPRMAPRPAVQASTEATKKSQPAAPEQPKSKLENEGSAPVAPPRPIRSRPMMPPPQKSEDSNDA